jgi:cholesterol transport system auxiliary component
MLPRPAIYRTLRRAGTGLILVATAGCVQIGSKPPERLLGISADVRVPAGTSQSATPQSALFVEAPGVPRTISTQRVAVRANATSYAYVKNALWADTPAHQFQALLGETIAARTGRLVLDPRDYAATPGQVLHGELTEFGIDARSGTAVVTYDASLLTPDGQAVRRQRFSATAPVGKIDADSVAPAISRAANEVAAQVADWIGKP